MAVNWIITQLDRQETKDSLSDVVLNVKWYAYETKIVDGEDYSGKEYGTVTLNAPDSSNFKTYKSLTQDEVISWVKNVLGTDEVTKIETSIATQITKATEPPVISGLPW
mgnify:CR=1 FL=1|tara:strand:- start:93 stop:419 length:327 start_codon:yes stop_codon:yes gene_type:complete